MSNISNYEDQYDEYNYDQDKLAGHGGKGLYKRLTVPHVYLHITIFWTILNLIALQFG